MKMLDLSTPFRITYNGSQRHVVGVEQAIRDICTGERHVGSGDVGEYVCAGWVELAGFDDRFRCGIFCRGKVARFLP